MPGLVDMLPGEASSLSHDCRILPGGGGSIDANGNACVLLQKTPTAWRRNGNTRYGPSVPTSTIVYLVQ